MYKLNYFNVSAVAIMFLVIISIFMRKLYRDRRGKYFFILTAVVFLSALFDLFAVFLDNLGDGNVLMKNFAHTGYILFHNITAPVYATYAIELVGAMYIINKHRIIKYSIFVPFVVFFILLMMNPFTNSIFYFDVNDTYTRGELFFVLYIVSALYITICFAFLVWFRKNVSLSRWISIVSMIPFTFVAVAIQYFNPNAPIEMFINALAVLFVFMMIQRPEETIDMRTGLRSENAFADDLNMDINAKKKFHIILIQLANYSKLSEFMNYMEVGNVCSMISDNLDDILKMNSVNSELYSLRKGCFGIVIKESSFNKSELVIQAVNDKLRETIHISHIDFNFIVNICVIKCPEDFDNFDSLSKFMSTPYDKTYYGKIMYANEIINAPSYDIRSKIDFIIKNAIENDKLQVYYQPIYSVKEKKFICAEALVRLIDDQYGFISPELFIPVAEKNGLIYYVGKFVFESVCKFISSDEFENLGVKYIDVNLSVAQCMRKNLSEEFIEIMKKYDISPEQITIEITETAASKEQSIISNNIAALNNYGLRFALDDFGTGYSNMQRIALLPLSVTKLDKMFTQQNGNERFESLIEGAVSMIKSMNMEIVVEGIENEEMLDKFTALGCELIQGYYYSKPLSQAEYIKFCTEKNCVSA